MSHNLICIKCGKTNNKKAILCSFCEGVYSLLNIKYQNKVKISKIKELYYSYLPFRLFKPADFKNCSLKKISSNIWIKNEGENKLKSIKEKELFVGLKVAQYFKFKKAHCVSSGSGIYVAINLAKYFDFPLVLYSPKSKKKVYKNQILLEKDYEDTFKKVIKLQQSNSFNITPGINPYSEQGAKVISWQIISSGINFDKIIIPCGNGSSLWGIYKGFLEAKENKLIKKMPEIWGAELQNGPIGRSSKTGKIEKNKSILNSSADAIDTKECFCLQKALIVLKDTKGKMIQISEKEAARAYLKLHQSNFKSCYTAASSFAAALKLNAEYKNGKICCILTASE